MQSKMPVKPVYIRFVFEKENKIHCQIEKGAMIASHENVKALSGGLNIVRATTIMLLKS